ncbi:putative proteinase inhibitor I4 serpin [Monocercomonoides exilis]|uniref:putative proteinase inhibitor I4 serpin n=1 Tax=Monocercomonoides exilis TaxID=2049356 RepID=UPI0035593A8B|nr:putative proteinase inhibitor I4 serpin [Monocercomonoides exilis]|eukprot:MONOS_2191.1-p1 / transcript=MONOS_2191.1 / gene=MONOS_2191 / organism=Monocercomonoides_exilis_PA203 / gene_product=proteinase inhibitor I4 serpin / transcript_product=proteinase inhibitor I4 serpin / location=Mono_scaffold00043:122956-124330(+) / protein_length=400 / sequence_SO=supercontig / SO=protein_coding / is_pseudo=false
MSLRPSTKKPVALHKVEVSVGEEEYRAAKALQAEYVDNFGAFLLEQVISETPGNIFISPLSVHTALMMTCAGSVDSTLEVMQEVLQLKGMPEKESFEEIAKGIHGFEKVHKMPYIMANSLWIDGSLSVNKEYLTMCRECFGGTAEVVSFSSKSSIDRINDWVKTKTKGLITKIFERLDSSMKMVLLNTVYFKDDFAIPFKAKLTRNSEFQLLSGEKSDCKMMKMTENLRYYATTDTAFVSLGFVNNNVRMLLMLPTEEGQEALNVCAMKYLRASEFKEITHHLSSQLVELYLPHFQVEFSLSLKQSLIRMGMGVCFGGDAKFAKISSDPLLISDVVHKTILKVNEKGVEAAAVTAVAMGRGFALSHEIKHPILFLVNRPFVVALYDRSSTIIFSGIVKSV